MNKPDRITKPNLSRFSEIKDKVQASIVDEVSSYSNQEVTSINDGGTNELPSSFDVFEDDIKRLLDSTESTNISLYNELYDVLCKVASESKNKSLTAKSLLNNIVYDWFNNNTEKVKHNRKSIKSKLSKKLLG